jgi:hypothetical protein
VAFVVVKQARRLDDLRREFDDVDARNWMPKRRADGDAAAQTDHRHVTGLLCRSSGKCASSFCVNISLGLTHRLSRRPPASSFR